MSQENRERLEKVLKELGISFQLKAKNSLNITCPFCNDDGYHLGIYLDNLSFSCWKCKSGGRLFDVLSEITGIGWEEFELLVKRPYSPSNQTAEQEILSILKARIDSKDTKKEVEWPPKMGAPLKKMLDEPLVRAFAKKRNLDLDFCVEEDVYIGLVGKWTNRFIIPVRQQGQVVAYQGRDMTNKIEPRYRTEGDISAYLYDFDHIDVRFPVAITEGVINAWTIGENAIASFTKSLSGPQIALMWQKASVPMWILCWDIGQDGSDAFWTARTVGQNLVSLFGAGRVGRVEFPPGKDANDLGYSKMKQLLQNPIPFE